MKPRTISIAVVALASALLLGASHMSRVQSDVPHGCSNATLKGSYGFYRTGFNADGPLVGIGIMFLDGNGNTTFRQTVSRNGDISFGRKNSGTYDVASDCTLKDDAGHLAGVVVDNGNVFYTLSGVEGNTIYLVGTKIHQE